MMRGCDCCNFWLSENSARKTTREMGRLPPSYVLLSTSSVIIYRSRAIGGGERWSVRYLITLTVTLHKRRFRDALDFLVNSGDGATRTTDVTTGVFESFRVPEQTRRCVDFRPAFFVFVTITDDDYRTRFRVFNVFRSNQNREFAITFTRTLTAFSFQTFSRLTFYTR